ncbi:MAG: hypothetical protein ACMG6H_00225 [Acidobacteriota bacterium]
MRVFPGLGNRNCLDKLPQGADNHADTRIGIMGFVVSTARKIAFWTYPRTSWQWDVLCVLILVFIFLTPKSWFANTAFQRTHTAQTTVVMSTDVVGTQLDKTEIERRAKQLAGRPDAAVAAVRERHDDAGKLIGYEVDFR